MNLEELVYEFGNVMYTLGRYETDERETTKEYNKLIKRKEELYKLFDEFFKASSRK